MDDFFAMAFETVLSLKQDGHCCYYCALFCRGMGAHHVMYSRHHTSGPLVADAGIAVVATMADSKDARNQGVAF